VALDCPNGVSCGAKDRAGIEMPGHPAGGTSGGWAHLGSISAACCHQAMGQAKGEARGGGLLARGAWWVSSNEPEL